MLRAAQVRYKINYPGSAGVDEMPAFRAPKIHVKEQAMFCFPDLEDQEDKNVIASAWLTETTVTHSLRGHMLLQVIRSDPEWTIHFIPWLP